MLYADQLSPVLPLLSTTFHDGLTNLHDPPLLSLTPQVYSCACDWVQSAAEANETSRTRVQATPEQTRCRHNIYQYQYSSPL